LVSEKVNDLARKIMEKRGEVIIERLETNEKVIAHVSEGIYRQPAASLRELISNAYDADATSVVIHTDAPRFEKIIVRDNGLGMTEMAIASLIKEIGGSPKRTPDGYEIGVSNKENPLLSPGGRKLIGKIGIGILSISRLSRHFKIITKVKGNKFRTFIEVALKPLSEEELPKKREKKDRLLFQTGEVRIESVPAEDVNSHGTEVIIMGLHDAAKNELRSMNIWKAADASAFSDSTELRYIPSYHIGRMDDKNKNQIKTPAELPWSEKDNPEKKIERLYRCVITQFAEKGANPKLETIFDNYLRMIWTLALSVPIDYIDIHPFDVKGPKAYGKLRIFRVGNEKGSKAKEVKLAKGKRIRGILALKSPERGGAPKFEVVVDGIKLMRPIKLWNNLATGHKIKYPILFVGKFKPNLSKFPKEITGGKNLSFEGYFLWVPKVVPTEHRGVMLRIIDVSSGSFDSSFMEYQVSEQTRLKQITAEIFVNEGLDPAMNIDRESFNKAHPHYQVITAWVHNALRQITTRHKDIGSEIRKRDLETGAKKEADEFEKFVDKEISEVAEEPEEIPEVILSAEPEKIRKKRSEGTIVFDKKAIFPAKAKGTRTTQKMRIEDEYFEREINALVKILYAFGVFEDMPYEKQQELVRRIANIFGYSFGG